MQRAAIRNVESRHDALHRVASRRLATRRVASRRVMTRRVVTRRVATRRVPSRRIAPRHFASRCNATGRVFTICRIFLWRKVHVLTLGITEDAVTMSLKTFNKKRNVCTNLFKRIRTYSRISAKVIAKYRRSFRKFLCSFRQNCQQFFHMFSSLRWILSNFCPNRSYPWGFSAI